MVKEEKTHHRCRHVGYEGGRPNSSLWAEFWLIPWWDRKNLIGKNNWDVAKNNGRKGEELKNSLQKHTARCLLLLPCQWWGREAKLQSVGWVLVDPVMGPQEFNWKNNWDIAKNNGRKGEEIKISLQKHTKWCLLLLACRRQGQEAKLQSVGWVLANPVMGPQEFNWKKLDVGYKQW